MIIIHGDKIYSLRFGLKGLTAYNELLDTVENEKLKILCGLITDQDVTMKEVEELSQLAIVKNYISDNFRSLSPTEINELYQLSAEAGIAYSDFLKMTERDIRMAYQGYLNRKEFEANLIYLAINSDDYISFDSDGYEFGTEEERKDILKFLEGETQWLLQNK